MLRVRSGFATDRLAGQDLLKVAHETQRRGLTSSKLASGSQAGQISSNKRRGTELAS